jgi:hypothetical protein
MMYDPDYHDAKREALEDDEEPEDELDHGDDDQALGDYDVNGPDRLTWADVDPPQRWSYTITDLAGNFISEGMVEAGPVRGDGRPTFEDDDNRFAGLHSGGVDIFGRDGWSL